MSAIGKTKDLFAEIDSKTACVLVVRTSKEIDWTTSFTVTQTMLQSIVQKTKLLLLKGWSRLGVIRIFLLVKKVSRI